MIRGMFFLHRDDEGEVSEDRGMMSEEDWKEVVLERYDWEEVVIKRDSKGEDVFHDGLLHSQNTNTSY